MKSEKYDQEFLSTVNTTAKSFDGKVYICKAWHLQVSKFQVPCQAVANNLYLDKIPEAIKISNKLETSLPGKMLLFKKVVKWPRGKVQNS